NGRCVIARIANQAEEVPGLGRSAMLLEMGFTDLRSLLELASVGKTEGLVKVCGGSQAFVKGNMRGGAALVRGGSGGDLTQFGRHPARLNSGLRGREWWKFQCLNRVLFGGDGDWPGNAAERRRAFGGFPTGERHGDVGWKETMFDGQ